MKSHSLCEQTTEASVTQFFHILSTVAHPRGSVLVRERAEITVYSSCCDTARGVYHYTTYENRQISAVHLYREDLSGDKLITYPLVENQQIRNIN
jgi:choloylglycine hydrolase